MQEVRHISNYDRNIRQKWHSAEATYYSFTPLAFLPCPRSSWIFWLDEPNSNLVLHEWSQHNACNSAWTKWHLLRSYEFISSSANPYLWRLSYKCPSHKIVASVKWQTCKLYHPHKCHRREIKEITIYYYQYFSFRNKYFFYYYWHSNYKHSRFIYELLY